MQFFSFIFLARSWASDRKELASSLATLARNSTSAHTPLTLLLYPEGTLVSPYTRPVSAKYARSRGLVDPAHVLLPRATGLHYSLRALAPRVHGLRLVDLTIAYPGVPEAPEGAGEQDYAQGFYTLRSIFFDRVPPPVVHMHVRIFEVEKEVPIGELPGAHEKVANGDGLVNGTANGGEKATGNGHANGFGIERGEPAEVEFSEDERAAFDVWLRQLWTDKDALMGRFLANGSFGPAADATRVDVPVQLKTRREVLNAFAFFVPGVIGVICSRVKHLL